MASGPNTPTFGNWTWQYFGDFKARTGQNWPSFLALLRLLSISVLVVRSFNICNERFRYKHIICEIPFSTCGIWSVTHYEGGIACIMRHAFAQTRSVSIINTVCFLCLLLSQFRWHYVILSLDVFLKYIVLFLYTVEGLTPFMQSFFQQVLWMSLRILLNLVLCYG